MHMAGGPEEMRKSFALGAVALLLSGCAIPVPLQVASWALDGISFVMTKKSITDHGISMVADKDCALWRVVTEEEICNETGDATTILAAIGGVEDSVYTADEPDVAAALAPASDNQDPFAELAATPEEIAELAAFDTAAGPAEDNAGAGDAEIADYDYPVEAEMPEPLAELAKVDAGAGDTQVVEYDYPAEVETPEPVIVLADEAVQETVAPLKVADQVRRGEPMGGIYFVIGSFRSHGSALDLLDRHAALLPTILSASLDGGDIYRVVVGPAQTGAEQQLHRDLSKAGVADTWAIRVVPGEWTVAETTIEARNDTPGAELLAGLPD